MRAGVLLVLIASTLRSADPSAWCVAKLQSLDYPSLSLQARISGTVQLRLHIASDGSAGESRIVSGDKILSRAAQDNLRSWRFMRCAPPGEDVAQRGDDVEITYEFKLVGETRSPPKSQFSYEYPYHVTVTSAAPHWNP
jgi:TonB family protein